MPGANPVTKPVLVMDASNGLLLVHVPPEFGSIWIFWPTHTDVGPETTGSGLTVMVTEATSSHPPKVTVTS